MKINQNLTEINYNSMQLKNNLYIVIHYTGNSTDKAYSNTQYFKSVNRDASAHYFVDDNEIWQCVLDKDVAWHCGDKLKAGNGGKFNGKCTNYNSIGIEMCCTNWDISEKTEANTIELVKELMRKYNIPADRVIRHYDVTNKICPAPFVKDGKRWDNFKRKLQNNKPVVDVTGDITYQVYDNVKKMWLPEVVNDKDYAGNFGNSFGGVRAKCKYGDIIIESHVLGGGWLSSINSKTYAKNSNNGNSYSGILGKRLDMVRISSTKGYVEYRTHAKGGTWFDWVDSRTKTGSESYAGVKGVEIDAIQMR